MRFHITMLMHEASDMIMVAHSSYKAKAIIFVPLSTQLRISKWKLDSIDGLEIRRPTENLYIAINTNGFCLNPIQFISIRGACFVWKASNILRNVVDSCINNYEPVYWIYLYVETHR